MTDIRIQIAKDWVKIKGAEKSIYILLLDNHTKSISILPRNHPKVKADRVFSGGMFDRYTILPYLRLAYEDGKLSSASIREGLGLDIFWATDDNQWAMASKRNTYPVLLFTNDPKTNKLIPLNDPVADEPAMQLGIIEYWKQYPKEVEDYLEGLK